jgi:teichuronic acid biosynthesis glycosyltransferase TuaC
VEPRTLVTTMETQLVGEHAELVPEVPRCSLRILAVIPGTDEGSSFVFARRQIDSLKKLGHSIDTFHLRSRTSPVATIREGLRLRRVLAKLQPDLVHAHYGTVTSCLCALCVRAALVITFRGSDLNPASEVATLRAVSGLLLSQLSTFRAQAIICTSKQLKTRLWWRRENAVVIPSGVDLELFKPGGQGVARQELSLPLSEKIVIFNAGTNPILKGLGLAQQAVAIAEKSVGRIRFIQLDGAVSPNRIPLYMNAADCLVLASKAEGSPNVVKEAMACNLPVVGVNVGDSAEQLQGVSASHIVDRDPIAMGEAIAEVLKAGQRSNGRERIERYSQQAVARLISDVYLAAVLLRNEISGTPNQPFPKETNESIQIP